MKRFIPVLAIALILALMPWEDASSKRYPQLRLETVQWDHPWGGEHFTTVDPPIVTVSPSTPTGDLLLLDIVKFWYRNVGGSFFYRFNVNIKETQPAITDPLPPTEVIPQPEANQASSQGGSGL